MKPEDCDEEFELENEAENWDEETLGLDWDADEIETLTRDIVSTR
jgi:hypothetical protein